MSNLYIRLPSRASIEHSVQDKRRVALSFARVSPAGAILEEGTQLLSGLAEQLARVKRVVLLISASDVTVLRVATPPLSRLNLRRALPHLVVDQLMTDPAECVMVAGSILEGSRSVAITQRDWLAGWIQAVLEASVKSAFEIRALPAQFCLPYLDQVATFSVLEQDDGVEIAARLSKQQGIGLSVVMNPNIPLAQEVIQLIQTLASTDKVILYVPFGRVSDYCVATQASSQVRVIPDTWGHWVQGARGSDALALNLAEEFKLRKGLRGYWIYIRWVVVILAIHILGLNMDRWRLEREASNVQHSMIDLFVTAFPKEKVIVDPLVQARQKMVALKQELGQSSPEDFVSLVGQVSQAWSNIKNGMAPELISLEYKEHGMVLRVLPHQSVDSAWMDQFKEELQIYHLKLTSQETGIWHIQIVK